MASEFCWMASDAAAAADDDDDVCELATDVAAVAVCLLFLSSVLIVETLLNSQVLSKACAVSSFIRAAIRRTCPPRRRPMTRL